MYLHIVNFNSIKLNLINKTSFFFLKKNEKTIILLNLFLKYNIIYGYNEINIKNTIFLKIFLNTNYPHKRLKNIFKLSKIRHIKYKAIAQLKNKNTLSNYILSTNRGLVSLNEAKHYQIGGILMFKLY